MPLNWCREPRCRSWWMGFQGPHEHDFKRPRQLEETGLMDKLGYPICEGDILLEKTNEFYGIVPVVVRWAIEKGAWTSAGEFADGGGHNSLNGEHFKNCEKIGNIDSERSLYHPAKKLQGV